LSHIVTLKTAVRDSTAITAACRRLGLAEPVHGTAKMYAGEIEGLLVQLPGWKYPIAIDTQSGDVNQDNFGGHWGDGAELSKFIQMYAVEKCRIEARRAGHSLTETQLQDGSIKLQIQEGS
jgi:hypothetical protein